MEFKTIKTMEALKVSRNVIARVRSKVTKEISVIVIDNWNKTISEFKKEFIKESGSEYSLAWAVFAPVDENEYDAVIEREETKWAEMNRKSCEYHKNKKAKELAE